MEADISHKYQHLDLRLRLLTMHKTLKKTLVNHIELQLLLPKFLTKSLKCYFRLSVLKRKMSLKKTQKLYLCKNISKKKRMMMIRKLLD